MHFRLTHTTHRGGDLWKVKKANYFPAAGRRIKFITLKKKKSWNTIKVELNQHFTEKKKAKLSFALTCFACFTSWRCLTRRFGNNDVPCLDVVIYCVSVHAVTYCRPGNMSDGAMFYTAVCFFLYGLNLCFCNVLKN